MGTAVAVGAAVGAVVAVAVAVGAAVGAAVAGDVSLLQIFVDHAQYHGDDQSAAGLEVVGHGDAVVDVGKQVAVDDALVFGLEG